MIKTVHLKIDLLRSFILMDLNPPVRRKSETDLSLTDNKVEPWNKVGISFCFSRAKYKRSLISSFLKFFNSTLLAITLFRSVMPYVVLFSF